MTTIQVHFTTSNCCRWKDVVESWSIIEVVIEDEFACWHHCLLVVAVHRDELVLMSFTVVCARCCADQKRVTCPIGSNDARVLPNVDLILGCYCVETQAFYVENIPSLHTSIAGFLAVAVVIGIDPEELQWLLAIHMDAIE